MHACNAMNIVNNVYLNFQSRNWRLPTTSETYFWDRSGANITNLGLCDSNNSYSPYCVKYNGCNSPGGIVVMRTICGHQALQEVITITNTSKITLGPLIPVARAIHLPIPLCV